MLSHCVLYMVHSKFKYLAVTVTITNDICEEIKCRINMETECCYSLEKSSPLWARRQHARLSRSGPGFDPRSGQVSWVRFFSGFFLTCKIHNMSGSFRPTRSPNIIWPSLSSSNIIHYGRQCPEMFTRPKTLNIHTLSRLFSKSLKRHRSTYKTIILPVILYGRETWFLTLREEQRLRVFQNKVLGASTK